MNEKSNFPYLHGFSNEEQNRLGEQARFGEHSIYRNINIEGNSKVLEIGCGTGAQSEILLRRYPEISLTGLDLSEKQLEVAKKNLQSLTIAKDRYELFQMNGEDLRFPENSYDVVFICWFLEHVPHPERVLSEARRVLRPGGKIFCTEVMNSSFFLEPYSPNIWKYWMAFNDFQYENSGDPFIGAKLGNLSARAGFNNIKTEVITWHYDNREPSKRMNSILFWKDLLMSASDLLLKSKAIDQKTLDLCKEEFDQVAKDPNAVFLYSFMQSQCIR